MGNSASALPYVIDKETHSSTLAGSYGWSMHSGKRKSDGVPVTVFKAEKKVLVKKSIHSSGSSSSSMSMMDPTLCQIIPALYHFQKIKTLIHPNILRTYATLDTDFPNGETTEITNQINQAIANPASTTILERFPTTGDLIIVTEQVVPLVDFLNEMKAAAGQNNAELISWGVYSIIQALDFLHNTAKLAHGNISMHSIFVTPSGDFKLGGFNLLTTIGEDGSIIGPTKYFKHFEKDITPREYRSPERIDGRWEAIMKSPIHAMDSYSFGIFLEELYRHPGSGTNQHIPEKLVKAVQRLKISSISVRPRIAPLLQCPVFENHFIKAQLFLDSIAAKPSEEKIAFLQSLPDLLNRHVLPSCVALHKVLPILIRTVTTIAGSDGAMNQDVNRRECLAVVPPLLQIAEQFLVSDADKFTLQMKPIVELLFRLNDRGVRGVLLTKMNLFVKFFDNTMLNNSVFDPLCSGFTDSSAPLRELTLKSSLLLVPHLSAVSFEKLVRYLIRLQSDQEASVRTNTVIFIGKIAGHLSEVSRSKLLLPAFSRAMKDPFNPCRLAACKAVWTCKDFFEPKAVAEHVLPSLAPYLVDPVEEIRLEAFQVLEGFLNILRKESERLSQQTQMDSAVSGPNIASPSITETPATQSSESMQNSNGYLSGWGSWAAAKITTSTKASNSDAADSRAEPVVSNVSSTSRVDQVRSDSYQLHNEPSLTVQKPSVLHAGDKDNDHQDKDFSGWSDNEDDLSDSIPTKSKVQAKVGGPQVVSRNYLISTDTNEFMSQFENSVSKPLKSSGGKLITPQMIKAPLANRKMDLLEQGKIDKEKQKMIATKLNQSADDDIKDGWDDF